MNRLSWMEKSIHVESCCSLNEVMKLEVVMENCFRDHGHGKQSLHLYYIYKYIHSLE